jgi:hypothetical protein
MVLKRWAILKPYESSDTQYHISYAESIIALLFLTPQALSAVLLMVFANTAPHFEVMQSVATCLAFGLVQRHALSIEICQSNLAEDASKCLINKSYQESRSHWRL